MPLEMLNQIKARLSAMPSARAGLPDPELVGEALLLLRMILRDAELRQREIDLLRRVAKSAFALNDPDSEAVTLGLRQFTQQAGMGQAAAFFRGLDVMRRRLLARRLIGAMQADPELKARQIRFRVRLLELLDLRPDDLLEPAA